MAEREIRYDTTFADFQFLQGYMTRRVAARNRGPHLRALMSVVLCAFFIAMAIVLNVDPYRAITLSGGAVPYPISFYVMLIVLLIVSTAWQFSVPESVNVLPASGTNCQS